MKALTKAAAAIGDGIVVLDRVHRYGEGIAEVADAIRRGDADGAIAALAAGVEGVTWIADDPAAAAESDVMRPVRDGAVAAARTVIQAAQAGDARAAIATLSTFRVLCAHRRGAHGVATWMERIERWLAATVPGFAAEGEWYAGRPLLVTENDYGLRLYNGDTGVVVAEDDRLVAAFDRGLRFSPTRLSAVDTAYAMTIHKSQGSQFGTAAVLLPEPDARILTRELLYTAYLRFPRAFYDRHATGQVLSREQILRAVWGYEYDPGTNVVDVYIGYLRRKLRTQGTNAPIVTVRSVGYRLDATA